MANPSKRLVDTLPVPSARRILCRSHVPAVLTQIAASMGSIMDVDTPDYYKRLEGSELSSRCLKGFHLPKTPGFEHLGPAPISSLPSRLSLPPELKDGSEGRMRIQPLAFNVHYFSRALTKLGFIVFGHVDLPIIPLLSFNPGKMSLFSHLMKERKIPIIVVIVGTPHLRSSPVEYVTKWDVDELPRACDEVGEILTSSGTSLV